jgi:hypothetical protein
VRQRELRTQRLTKRHHLLGNAGHRCTKVIQLDCCSWSGVLPADATSLLP